VLRIAAWLDRHDASTIPERVVLGGKQVNRAYICRWCDSGLFRPSAYKRHPIFATLAPAVAPLLFLLGFAGAVHATQYSATGTITAVRTHTSLYGVATLQGVSIFQLSTGPGNGCSWLYLAGTDANSLASLLAAKADGAVVTVWYDNTAGSPWGDPTTCAAQAIQQN
jgi:hypothetical protein